MDEISSEALASLINQKVKLEVKGKVLTGSILAVNQETIKIKLMNTGKMAIEKRVDIEDIDAIFFLTKTKPVGY